MEYTIHLESNSASFLCENCGYVLGKVYEMQGLSVLKIFAQDNTQFMITGALVECPICFHQRAFISHAIGKDLIV